MTKFSTRAQARALLFHVGDEVNIFGVPPGSSGFVIAVHPALGMVDVDFPHKVMRLAANELQNLSHKGYLNEEGAPMFALTRKASQKTALYWAAPDRKYRATKSELPAGPYLCPRCKDDDGFCIRMRKSTLNRSEGVSSKIWVCPSCTFAIQDSDIINCPME